MERGIWYKGNIPFVRFLLAYALGILSAFYLSPKPICLSMAYAVCGTLFLAIVLCHCFKKWNGTKIGLHGLLVFLFLMAVGLVLVWRGLPSVNEMHFSKRSGKQLVGYIRSETIEKNGRLRFDFEVTGVVDNARLNPAEGRLLVNVSVSQFEAGHWGYGKVLLLPQNYHRVEGPKNPDEFDYRNYLSHRQIYHQAFVQEEQVLHTESYKGNPIVGLALQWRQKLMDKYRFYIKNEMAFNVLSALVLGYRADIDQELYNAFSTTGTIHVLSVSGMHVGMVYWLLSFLLGWIRGGKGVGLLKCVLFVVAIWVYCILTGLSPSTLRASVMISFVVVAQSFSRQHQVFNTIAASAFFLLLFNPYFLADVGFQLSYLAVLGIAWLYAAFNRLWPTKHWFTRQVRDACSISLAAQLFTSPLSLHYFHLFPNYFLLGNLFVGFPAMLIVYGGLLVHFLPYGKMAETLSYLLEQLIVATMDGLLFLSRLPFSSVSGVWLSEWQTLLWYTLMVFALFGFLYREKGAFLAASVSLLVIVAGQMYQHFDRHGSRQLVFHQVGRNWAITYAKSGSAFNCSNLESPSNKQFRYSVEPSLQHFHHAAWQFVPDASAREGYLLRLGDLKIVLLEKGVALAEATDEVDFVLLRHNAIKELSALSLTDITLIVDGSNTDETVANALAMARARNWKAYKLKDNFAYVWNNKTD